MTDISQTLKETPLTPKQKEEFEKKLREANEKLLRENMQYTKDFVEIPKEKWPENWKKADRNRLPFRVLRNNQFFVQCHRETHGITRITVNRIKLKTLHRWDDEISWDDLQWVKNAVGYAHKNAVEVFPEQKRVVNVANMRHLWVLPNDFNAPFVW